MTITEDVERYRNAHRDLSIRKLAIKIMKDYGDNFHGYTSSDTLRKAIPDLLKTPHSPLPDLNSEFSIDIPAGYFEDRTPYVLAPIYNNVLVLNDIHIPYHNAEALRLALTYGYDRKINAIILNGDTIDCYQISRFSKKPTNPSLKTELEMTRLILERIRDKFPNAKIVWKDGNHDERLELYIRNQAPALYDLDERPTVRTLLGLDKLRIDYVTDKKIIKIGKLNLIHGHEILSGSGAVNLARTVRLKANANVMFGHFHKTQEDISTNIEHETTGSWAVGCLCDLSPEYLSINGWNLGFAHVEVEQNGNFETHNKKIVGGQIK